MAFLKLLQQPDAGIRRDSRLRNFAERRRDPPPRLQDLMSCQPSRRSPHFVTIFVPLLSAKRYRLFTHSFALLFEMSTTPVRCGCPCIVSMAPMAAAEILRRS